jgi:hypothetical protein
MGGNPYGKDVFKYGTEDWHARKMLDESRAKKLAPPPRVSSPFPGPTASTPANIVNHHRQTGPGTSAGGGVGVIAGLAKLVVLGIGVLAVIGYFGSSSTSASRPSPVEDSRPSDTYATQPPPTPSEAPAPHPAVPVEQVATSSLTLPGGDERVIAAVNEVRFLSRRSLFVAKEGDALVFEGHLDTPDNNLVQTSFNVANLDLDRSTYSVDGRNLNIQCKTGASCISYSVFEHSTELATPALKERTAYGAINIWSASQEDASRIVQDLQQLQKLQQ